MPRATIVLANSILSPLTPLALLVSVCGVSSGSPGSNNEPAASTGGAAVKVHCTLGGIVAALALELYVPLLHDLFGFAPYHPTDLLICVVAGLASILWLEISEVVRTRWGKEHFRVLND
jgi:hypothetical protein